MQLKLTWRYGIAFMAFVFVFGQLHEIAHLVKVYTICGIPGKQLDFNLWIVDNSCVSNPGIWMATLFGPIFSYLAMGLGFFLLLTSNKNFWPIGFVLVLGNLPFARIFTAAMGGGDETTVLKSLLLPGWSLLLIKIAGFLTVFILSFPPLYMCFKRLQGKSKFFTITGFCVLPLIIMLLYEFKLLGLALKTGFLADRHYLGIPDLILLHTFLMATLVLLNIKTLFGSKLILL